MADRYWVGGTGNWDASTTTNWSTSSGGAGGASVPTASDNVIFNTSSSTAENAYTVTITATATCLDFTMDGPSTTDATKVTWAGSAALNISGSLNLSGGTVGITKTYTGTITFNATSGTKTLATNSVPFLSSIDFNGVGGTFQLATDFRLSGAKSIFRTNGTFDANGKTITLDTATNGFQGSFTGSNSLYNLVKTGGVNKFYICIRKNCSTCIAPPNLTSNF